MTLRFGLAALTAAAGLALSGCGGGGGGNDGRDDGSERLTTAAGVAHELAVIGQVTGLGEDNGVDAVGRRSPQTAALTRTRRELAALRRQKDSNPSSAAAATPSAAAAPVACSGGGTATTDEGTKAFNFTYFDGPNTQVSYQTRSDVNCVDDSGDTTSGYQELGTTGSAQTAAAANVIYGYLIQGQGSTPYTERDIDRDGNQVVSDLTYRSLGQLQIKSTPSAASTIYKALDQEEITGTDSGTRLAVKYQLGNGDAPFTISEATEGRRLDGRYDYDLDRCSGDYNIATTAPLVSSSNSSDTPTGGTIKLSSGANSVTVTFQQDGGAVLLFGNGTSATLTRDQIESANPLDC